MFRFVSVFVFGQVGDFSLIMASVQEFLRTPSAALLELCSREEVIEIAGHYQVDVGDKRMKDNMKRILREII